MKRLFCSPREWGWIWIVMGLWAIAAPKLLGYGWPPAALFLAAAVAILFGIIAWPIIRRVAQQEK